MKIDLKKKVLLLLLCSNFLPAFPQVLLRKDYLKALEQADVMYYYEQNYERAAVLYESLLKDYPGNANLSAKLGICCLKAKEKLAYFKSGGIEDVFVKELTILMSEQEK